MYMAGMNARGLTENCSGRADALSGPMTLIYLKAGGIRAFTADWVHSGSLCISWLHDSADRCKNA